MYKKNPLKDKPWMIKLIIFHLNSKTYYDFHKKL